MNVTIHLTTVDNQLVITIEREEGEPITIYLGKLSMSDLLGEATKPVENPDYPLEPDTHIPFFSEVYGMWHPNGDLPPFFDVLGPDPIFQFREDFNEAIIYIGSTELKGTWQYNAQKGEFVLTMDFSGTGVPVDVTIYMHKKNDTHELQCRSYYNGIAYDFELIEWGYDI